LNCLRSALMRSSWLNGDLFEGVGYDEAIGAIETQVSSW